MATVAAAITPREQRQFAYEMAVCVCDADGATSPAERDFLARLAQPFFRRPGGGSKRS